MRSQWKLPHGLLFFTAAAAAVGDDDDDKSRGDDKMDECAFGTEKALLIRRTKRFWLRTAHIEVSKEEEEVKWRLFLECLRQIK